MNMQTELAAMNDEISIILIGFSYDNATKITFPWISDENFLSTYSNNKIFRFHTGSVKEKQRLKELLREETESHIITVEIFLGHGIDNALLGPPINGIRQKHSPFYEIDMISNLPSSLFAYCCFSANKFGLKYVMSENKVFMGFVNKVFLPYEVLSELKRIFQEIAENIVEKRKIDNSHKEKFQLSIENLIKDVESGKIKCNFPERIIRSYLKPYIKHMRIM